MKLKVNHLSFTAEISSFQDESALVEDIDIFLEFKTRNIKICEYLGTVKGEREVEKLFSTLKLLDVKR